VSPGASGCAPHRADCAASAILLFALLVFAVVTTVATDVRSRAAGAVETKSAPELVAAEELYQNEYLATGATRVDALISVTATGTGDAPHGRETAELVLVDVSGSMNFPRTKIKSAVDARPHPARREGRMHGPRVAAHRRREPERDARGARRRGGGV
jgi:hypothetical protein